MVGCVILSIFATQIYSMANYEGYYHKSITSVANLTDIGIVNLDDMGTMPFYSVHYKGHSLPIKS